MVQELSKKQLLEAFANFGIENGDNLIIHSSYRAIGKVAKGPLTVIEALLEVIGSSGNLMLPTFNYGNPGQENFFDPAETPCLTGIISELGRKHPKAIRSLHPSHSVAVIGPDGEELIADHLKVRAIGINSPIDRLAKKNGKVILLGVGHIANSTIHIAEEYAGIPKGHFWGEPLTFKIRMPNGKIIEHSTDTSSSCSLAFGCAELPLRRAGKINDYKIGICPVQIMSGQSIIEVITELLTDEPGIMKCNDYACKCCHEIQYYNKKGNY